MKIILCICAISLFFVSQAQKNPPNADSSHKDLKTADVLPQFPGGTEAWNKFLQKKLRYFFASDYIKLRKGQTDSSEIAIVSFLLNKQGAIIDAEVENRESVHPEIAEECIKLVQKSPKWVPAIKDGQPTIFRMRQSITFKVTRR